MQSANKIPFCCLSGNDAFDMRTRGCIEFCPGTARPASPIFDMAPSCQGGQIGGGSRNESPLQGGPREGWMQARAVIHNAFGSGFRRPPVTKSGLPGAALLRHIKPRRASPLRRIKARSGQLLKIPMLHRTASSKTRATPSFDGVGNAALAALPL
jgi:hypothetical protein